MDSRVEVKAEYIQEECRKVGVHVNCEYQTEPLDFAIISNEQGDMGSISADNQVYEPRTYIPKWSRYMKKWAKAEGFSKDQIEGEDLLREVTIKEMVEFLTKKDIINQ